MTSESPDSYLETLRGMSREVYDAMLSALPAAPPSEASSSPLERHVPNPGD